MSKIKLKDVLLENPDTLMLRDKTTGESIYIGYGGDSNVVTGIIFSDEVDGTRDNYIAMVEDPKVGQRAVAELHKPELNSKAIKFLTTDRKVVNSYSYEESEECALTNFINGRKGHSYLEDEIISFLDHLYGKKDGYKHYHEQYRFRIFFVDDKHYFTIWSSSINLFKDNLPLFTKIVKDCGLNVDAMIWEVRTEDVGENRVKLVDMAGLHKLMGTEHPSAESQSEIQKRISELSKKLADMESDEHVKGATWTESEKRRHKIDMINIKAELEALSSAMKSGEKEIKNVVIKTIDSLEGHDGDVVPADILYAELEKKLSKYGTSAVAIIRNLRDKGIDIKKALREMNEKFGGRTTVTELIGELSKYMNKQSQRVNENDHALVAPNTISRFKETASTPEEFLKMFKGHALKDLLDKLSFCRLYVMNKFDSMSGDDPQQKFVSLLDAALLYVNYRLISPHRKKVDDADAEERNRPEVVAYRKKQSEILKQAFAAQRQGDHDRASKLRQQSYDMENPSKYGDNMKIMDAEVKKIHATPLSIQDVTPSPNDSDEDKKRYSYFVKSFEKFKEN